MKRRCSAASPTCSHPSNAARCWPRVRCTSTAAQPHVTEWGARQEVPDNAAVRAPRSVVADCASSAKSWCTSKRARGARASDWLCRRPDAGRVVTKACGSARARCTRRAHGIATQLMVAKGRARHRPLCLCCAEGGALPFSLRRAAGDAAADDIWSGLDETDDMAEAALHEAAQRHAARGASTQPQETARAPAHAPAAPPRIEVAGPNTAEHRDPDTEGAPPSETASAATVAIARLAHMPAFRTAAAAAVLVAALLVFRRRR